MDEKIAAQPELYAASVEGDAVPTLKGGRCRACGYVFFPPQHYGCEVCGALPSELESVPLRGSGVLNSGGRERGWKRNRGAALRERGGEPMKKTLREMRPVYVVGIGLHRYQRMSETSYVTLGLTAVREALADAKIEWRAVESASTPARRLSAWRRRGRCCAIWGQRAEFPWRRWKTRRPRARRRSATRASTSPAGSATCRSRSAWTSRGRSARVPPRAICATWLDRARCRSPTSRC